MSKVNYLTPLNIPEGKSGDWEIKHDVRPAGDTFRTVNGRVALFSGRKGESLSWDHPTRWHQLCESGSRWMSDWPIERDQMERSIKGMKGNVLVGGLGLGLVAVLLARKKTVRHVTVVEIEPDVVNLVLPHLPLPERSKIQVVTADLLKYLKTCHPVYDYAFYDIWCGDGEQTFHDLVVPLHQLSALKVRTRPVNWNEDIMRGQLVHAITMRLAFLGVDLPGGQKTELEDLVKPVFCEGKPHVYHNWSCPFYQWMLDTKPEQPAAMEMARVYAGLYGVFGWERLWDEAKRKAGEA